MLPSPHSFNFTGYIIAANLYQSNSQKIRIFVLICLLIIFLLIAYSCFAYFSLQPFVCLISKSPTNILVTYPFAFFVVVETSISLVCCNILLVCYCVYSCLCCLVDQKVFLLM